MPATTGQSASLPICPVTPNSFPVYATQPHRTQITLQRVILLVAFVIFPCCLLASHQQLSSRDHPPEHHESGQVYASISCCTGRVLVWDQVVKPVDAGKPARISATMKDGQCHFVLQAAIRRSMNASYLPIPESKSQYKKQVTSQDPREACAPMWLSIDRQNFQHQRYPPFPTH